MAEVVGLVAATGQFIEQSIKIIELSKLVRDKYKDAPQEVENWRRQIESLQKVVETVRGSSALQVSEVNCTIDQCKSAGDSLLGIFETIQFSERDSFRHKAWRTVVSLTKEEDIRALFGQLEELKSTLALQISIIHLNQNNQNDSHIASLLEGIKLSSQPGSLEDRCLRALFVTDPISDRESLITLKGKRTPGTFEWIPKTHQYQEWNSSNKGLLWISGAPGKGKTIISIFLSKLLEKTKPDSTVIYFFCDNKEASRNSAVNVLRGLMSQLIHRHPDLLSLLLPTWNIQQDNLFRANSFETLWRIFVQMLDAVREQEVCFILDALDECDEESVTLLLRKFKSLFDPESDASPVPLKLIIASREEPKALPQTLASFPRLALDDLKSDIDLYIAEKVLYLTRIKNIEGSTLHRRIEEAFREGAKGTFLWVSYMAQDLEQRSLSEIETALTQLPHGLYEIYERILTQIKVGNRDKIAEMLMWILFAKTPLTIPELCDVIQIQASQSLTREEICHDYVLSCGHLLRTEKSSWLEARWSANKSPLSRLCVTFLHQSAKDFLLRPHANRSKIPIIIESRNAHKIMVDKLIGFLEKYLCDENDRRGDLYNRVPILSLAVNDWSYYMRQLNEDIKTIIQKRATFFGKTSKSRALWARHVGRHRTVGDWGLHFPLLHMACAEGLYWLAKELLQPTNMLSKLKRQLNVNKRRGSLEETALHLAVASGSLQIISLLLERGADVSVEDKAGLTPIHKAVQRSAVDAYTLMLSSKKGRRVFEIEFEYHMHNARALGKSSLLHLAARAGNDDLCAELIEKYKYSTEWKDGEGLAVIQATLKGRHMHLANRMVTEWGASLTPEIYILRAMVREYRLYYGCLKDYLHVYTNKWGCSINAVDEAGNTIFHDRLTPISTIQAAENLDPPIDWGRTNKKQETFIHCNPSWLDDPYSLNMYLQRSQYGINTQDREGCSPLHAFLLAFFKTVPKPQFLYFPGGRVIQELLDFGADRTLRDNQGRTAVDIARILLDDINAKKTLLFSEQIFIWALESWIDILTEYATVAVDARELNLQLDYYEGWPNICQEYIESRGKSMWD